MELSLRVYRETATFPTHELYGLAQQMRRAAVSIASNIAEGKGRRTNEDFRRFLFHARGSLMELETQILLAGRLEYLTEVRSKHLQIVATQVGRSLAGLLNALGNVAQKSAKEPTTEDRRPNND